MQTIRSTTAQIISKIHTTVYGHKGPEIYSVRNSTGLLTYRDQCNLDRISSAFLQG